MDKGIKRLMESNIQSSLLWRNFNYCTKHLGGELQRFSKINVFICKSFVAPSFRNVFLIVIRNVNQYFEFPIRKKDIIGSIDNRCKEGWQTILEELCFHT